MRRSLGKKSGSLGSAVGLVIASMAMPAHAQTSNLLINPGFESPTDNTNNTDTTATGWSFYGGDTERESFADGNNTPGGKWGIWEETFQAASGYSGVYQNVAVPAAGVGTTYSLSCVYYFESAYPTIPNEVSDLALTFLNASNQPVGTLDANGFSDEVDIHSNAAPATGAWLPYTVTGVAPAGATQVQVSFDFTNGSTVTGQQAAFVDDANLIGVGTPPTVATWAVNGSGDWNLGGNWTTGSVPNAVDAEADFTTISGITSAQTVYSNTPVTVGTMHFNNPNEYVIAGAGSITLKTSTGSALIKVDQGTDILQIPIIVASNTTLNVASGANLIVANTVAVNTGNTLTQTGTGTVTYQSIITVANAGAIAFGNSTYAHQLSLATGSKASVTGTGTVLQLDSLSNGGTLDLQKNALIIKYGSGADPIATIKSEITSGYAGGAWNGAGINSSVAAVNSGSFGIGYADSADPGNPAGLASGTIEVVYTLLGDANLDGAVNGSDFAILATNFNKAVSGWDQGDFNYDGADNGADFASLAANFNKGTTIAVADVAAVNSFATANGLTSVPEPTCMALTAVAAVGMLRRRRARSATV